MLYSKSEKVPLSTHIKSRVEGVGINDASYRVRVRSKGRVFDCPFYVKWRSMLTRCYSSKFHDKQPTYIGCTVHKDWLLFSNFKAWMETQEWEGKHLDKDILFPGNKVYSQETCIFITRQLNTLLTNNKINRTEGYPVGISYDTPAKRYRADISIQGKRIFLGRYFSIQEAKSAYNKAKRQEIHRQASIEQDNSISTALYRIAQEYI